MARDKTKSEKELQEEWEQRLHNLGLGMGRGLSHMVYNQDFSIGDKGSRLPTSKLPSLSEIEDKEF